MYIHDSDTCVYMFMFFNNCIYHVCQQLYTSIVYTLYIHGSDIMISEHVYARWSGFQMRVLQPCTIKLEARPGFCSELS